LWRFGLRSGLPTTRLVWSATPDGPADRGAGLLDAMAGPACWRRAVEPFCAFGEAGLATSLYCILWTNFVVRGALMNRRCVLGLCAIALVTIPAFPSSSVAQGKSLKDQLVGTWIYVSSTGKREDGSAVPRPSAQGAVTYTADGRFHFITVRTEVPKYASGDPARPSPEEAMAVASGVVAYTGTYRVDESTKTAHLNIETSSVPNFVGAPNQRRIVTSITDDELKLTNPRTPAGVTLELVFKRAK
jgi:hypothetical protein